MTGAMKCLVVGDPNELSTDVGPVISEAALARLRKHAARMRQESQLLYACPLDEKHELGYFFAPHLFELRALDQLKTEEFGPILHVVRYEADALPQVIDAVRRTAQVGAAILVPLPESFCLLGATAGFVQQCDAGS